MQQLNTTKEVLNEKIKISSLGIIVFLCGIPILYIVNISGELYVTEIALPIISLLIFLTSKEKKILTEKKFFLFLFFVFLLFIGYIISDLIAKTAEANYLKAWGRNLILISDITCLSLIFIKDKKLIWWYFLGTSAGSIIYLIATGVPFDNANWKLYYGVPTLLMTFCLSLYLPKNSAILFSFAIGIISFFWDGRSFGATCLLTSGILWTLKGNVNKNNIKKILKLSLAIAISGLIMSQILKTTNEEYSNRRDVSSLARSAAIRIAIDAIIESPFIGYGSWGEGTKKFAIRLFKETSAQSRKLGYANKGQGSSFLAHSQILQAWMEGGLLAGIFFIFYGTQIILTLKNITLNRAPDFMTPFYYFVLINGFWNLFFSPYSGGHRLNIAMTIALMCAISNEKQISSIKNHIKINAPKTTLPN